MKPIILYDSNETNFTSNGLGTLDEAITANVPEELNGTYELTLTYPVSGRKFSDIKYSRIIKCATTPGGDYQLFRIYHISKVKNGTVTINAEHISYQLTYIPVDAFTASSAADCMSKFASKAMTSCPFTFWTDKTTVANYAQDAPDNIRARLAGVQGSVLDVYGGEFEFDNYTVKLHNHRGQDRNVTLRYGKNITDIEQEENIASTYTSIVGYWLSEDQMVKTDVIDSTYASSYPYKRVKVVDFTSDFEDKPTVSQLNSKATAYMTANNFGIPDVNIKVSFLALWQTEDYKDVAPLERVFLGDTVSVYYEKLGITASAKVVKTNYNVLLDRYDDIELGKLRANLSDRLVKQDAVIKEQLQDNRSEIEKAVDRATDLIRGGMGGHVVLNTDANGMPQEILIMNQNTIEDSTKIWRWNLGGLGYSDHGYDGPYGTAITIDGAIVADYITAGTLNANVIRAGVLTDGQSYNYWNLATGEFRLSSGVTIGSQTFAQYAQSVQAQIDGEITSWFYDYAPTTSNAPASTWTTVAEKSRHIGDLFYYSSKGYCYRWQVKSTASDPSNPTLNDFEWVKIADEDISEALRVANTAQDTADHKRRVFVSQPVPPYDVGDLWCGGSNADIKTCTTARASGNYVSTDWTKENKYVDSSDISSAITTYDGTLNQTAIFNKLTNNGALQGLYMSSGNLYINATYIKAGIIEDATNGSSWNLTTGVMALKGAFKCGTDSARNAYSELSSGRLLFKYGGNYMGHLKSEVEEYGVIYIDPDTGECETEYFEDAVLSMRAQNTIKIGVEENQQLSWGETYITLTDSEANGNAISIEAPGGGCWINSNMLALNNNSLYINGDEGVTGNVTISGHKITVKNGIVVGLT